MCLLAVSAAWAQKTVQGALAEDETWSGTVMLDGYVYVPNGVTLTIEEGTVIQGLAADNISNADAISALIVSRGGVIEAEGTADEPIIFTSEFDDVTDDDDLNLDDETESRGLWGGVIIMGKAPIGAASTEATIEGLPEGDGTIYGGEVADDYSGTLKYVSIRHGGSEFAPDEEINGLTLGGVGSKTVIEHVEVVYNLDDGIEFFGGTVSVKWGLVAYCGDDGFDWDLGWRGNGQFWCVIGDTEEGDHGGELDGAKPDDNALYANPSVYNFTFIGGYDGSVNNAKNEHAILLRDGSAGTLANGVIAGYNNYALQIEETDQSKSSFGYMKDGDLKLLNNIWHDFGAGDSWDDVILPTPETSSSSHLDDVKSHLSDNNNELAQSGIDVTKRGKGLSVVPGIGSLADTKGSATPSGSWFSTADYIGAFEPGTVGWGEEWTAVEVYGLASFDAALSTRYTNVVNTNLYPNPANDFARLAFGLESNEQINIQITNLTGKVVMDLGSANYTSGNNIIEINVEALNSGVYFINLVSDKTRFTQRLIKE